jgi:hypothetical protein
MQAIETLDSRILFSNAIVDTTLLNDADVAVVFKATRPDVTPGKYLNVVGTKGPDTIYVDTAAKPDVEGTKRDSYRFFGIIGRNGNVFRYNLPSSSRRECGAGDVFEYRACP